MTLCVILRGAAITGYPGLSLSLSLGGGGGGDGDGHGDGDGDRRHGLEEWCGPPSKYIIPH